MKKEIGSNFWITSNDIKEKEYKNITPNEFGYKGDNFRWLSTGRSAILAAIIDIEKKINSSNKVAVVPPYTCHTVIEPFINLGYNIFAYDINEKMCLLEDEYINLIDLVKPSIVLIHRYFGYNTIKDQDLFVKETKSRGIKIIEDCTQSLYSSFNNFDADYYVCSIRKWCGVPDGGFIVSNNGSVDIKLKDADPLLEKTKKEASLMKYEYIFENKGRKEDFLRMYGNAEDILSNQDGYHKISPLSLIIQSNLDVEELMVKRKNNTSFLQQEVQNISHVKCVFDKLNDNEVPLYFPIISNERGSLQRYLAHNNVYAPIVWPKPEKSPKISKLVEDMYKNMLCIPIDQRYDLEDMERIVSLLKSFK